MFGLIRAKLYIIERWSVISFSTLLQPRFPCNSSSVKVNDVIASRKTTSSFQEKEQILKKKRRTVIDKILSVVAHF